MPPKIQFSKEDIISAAFRLIRREGMDSFTARAVAAELGASVKVLFRDFSVLSDLKKAVIVYAEEFNANYTLKAMQEAQNVPPYKASGLAYIRFAWEEPHLFSLLFMRDRSFEVYEEQRESLNPYIRAIIENTGLTEEAAYRLHLEMWIYVHGLASMIVTNYLHWDKNFILTSITDVYQGLKMRFESDPQNIRAKGEIKCT